MGVPAKFVETVCGGAVTVGTLPGHVEYAQLCVIIDAEDNVMGCTTVVEAPDTQVHAAEFSGVASWYAQDMLGPAVLVELPVPAKPPVPVGPVGDRAALEPLP